jgi:hypothetical protein
VPKGKLLIYAPLPPDSPLVGDGQLCGICHQRFAVGERITLQPLDLSSATARKDALPIHARCVLVGRETPLGRIVGIEEGAGVFQPVKIENGKRATFRQAGIDANE